jgi:hypothetical protein
LYVHRVQRRMGKTLKRDPVPLAFFRFFLSSVSVSFPQFFSSTSFTQLIHSTHHSSSFPFLSKMVSSIQQGDDVQADFMVPPPCASMRQWDFIHLPLAKQLQALGDDATPPSFSPVYFLKKWASEAPDAPCLLVPNATATAYVTFSYAQYDAATDVVARQWATKLNPSWLDVGRTQAMAALDAPVALLVKDLPTSHFLIISFNKLRVPVLLISTRNSPAGVSHLVATSKVSAILVEDSLRSMLEPQVAHIPTYTVSPIIVEELLRAPAVPPVPHSSDVDGDDVAIIVHSSGTTG